MLVAKLDRITTVKKLKMTLCCLYYKTEVFRWIITFFHDLIWGNSSIMAVTFRVKLVNKMPQIKDKLSINESICRNHYVL